MGSLLLLKLWTLSRLLFKLPEPDRSILPVRGFRTSRFFAAEPGNVDSTGRKPFEVEIVVVPMIRVDEIEVVEAEAVIVKVLSVMAVDTENVVVKI